MRRLIIVGLSVSLVLLQAGQANGQSEPVRAERNPTPESPGAPGTSSETTSPETASSSEEAASTEEEASPADPMSSPNDFDTRLRKPPARWYGWQTLTTDAASTAVMYAGIMRDHPVLAGLGLVGYSFGAPAIHVGRGRLGRAAASFGMRLATPALAAAAFGTCFESGESIDLFNADADRRSGWDTECIVLGNAALLSIPAAVAIDAIFLAREPREERTSSLSLSPWVAHGSGGMFARGRF